MIGMRHEKKDDLSFQNEHDGSVAHKTKNKVPFDSTKVNVMYTYDKEGRFSGFFILPEHNNLIIQDFLEQAYKETTSKLELFKMYDFLDDLIITSKLGSYNMILEQSIIIKLSTGLIIGLLRTSFVYRSKLKNWESFLLKSRHELINRKLDVEKLLIGF